MTKYTRIAWAVACATLLATPALGLGASATMRVEGATSTLIPRHQANIPPAGSSVILADSFDPSRTISVPSQSATALLARVLVDANVPVGFSVYDFGSGPSSFITRIGPDAAPAIWFTNAPWWKIKVNHKAASVGSDAITLAAGDDVLWAFGDGSEKELALSGPSTPLPVGTPFTVTVATYDDSAARTSGAGATVSYGDQRVTADASGTATLTSVSGVQTITAEAPRAIRDSARACGYPAANPEVCALAPLVLTLPDVAPNETISRVTITTKTGKTISVDLRTPIRGAAPVTISANNITDPTLTARERRSALGLLASALAWQLNDRIAQGNQSVAPPVGTRWRAAWLGRSTTVTPLAQGEAVVSQRLHSRTNAAINARTARVATQRLAACGINTHASVIQRFGYSMVVVAAPATGARACLARER